MLFDGIKELTKHHDKSGFARNRLFSLSIQVIAPLLFLSRYVLNLPLKEKAEKYCTKRIMIMKLLTFKRNKSYSYLKQRRKVVCFCFSAYPLFNQLMSTIPTSDKRINFLFTSNIIKTIKVEGIQNYIIRC